MELVEKHLELTKKVLRALEEVDCENARFFSLSEVTTELGCESHSGTTRKALVFPKEGIVYKFPRLDRYHGSDYCELEVENYNSAKQYRVEKLLLPIIFVGKTTGGVPVYIQPMYFRSVSELTYGERDRLHHKTTANPELTQKIRRGCYDSSINSSWIMRATQLYGKKFMRSFQMWTKASSVNDLHNANIGYIKGDRPVIIDYAGYHG